MRDAVVQAPHSRALTLPRFFFDIHEDGKLQKDKEGTELASFEEARREAQAILPAIAYETIPNDGDHKSFVVLVTDDEGQPVYSAALSYNGLWLLR